MNLHQLGISHVPVQNRQLSSPITSPYSTQPTLKEDVTEDNKDVLIDRLNDLELQLSKDSSFGNTTITAIHRKVDEIEALVRGERSRPKPVCLRSGSFSSAQGNDTFWGLHTSTYSLRMGLPETVKLPPPSVHEAEMPTSKAMHIARGAEQLSLHLSTVVTELQTRREESDHIHNLLIIRAGKAAERILLLEYRIAEMEDDLDANQSELEFLRIQLQSVEAQCSQYIPGGGNQDLTDSIINLKVDWDDIDRRFKARREKREVSRVHEDDALASRLPILRAISD